MLQDLSAPAIWAGLTAFVWYAFGAVPLQIAVSEQLGLSTAQTSSWIFIVWFSGAISSIVASLYFRQPIPITWTIPGLIYLGTLADQFSFPELLGANLVAGFLLILLGGIGCWRSNYEMVTTAHHYGHVWWEYPRVCNSDGCSNGR